MPHLFRVEHFRYAALVVLLAASAARGQSTGTISGEVVDSTAQVIPGASVTLVNEATGVLRTVVTNERGEFTFPAVDAGSYMVRVELSGFRTLERHHNVLSASDHLAVGQLMLSVGALTETVTVEARGAVVETRNSDGSALLTSDQIEQISTRGRDIVSLFRLLPGVRYTDGVESLGESFGSEIPQMGGQRANFNHVSIDGVIGNEIGGANRLGAAVSIDAIAEVKVLLGNYRAEFGRSAGANIQIVTKSGGANYRGSTYYYKRHEALNATEFLNNRLGLPKPEYRYDTYGLNLGGPVVIPRLLDASNRKAFFFYSFEAPLTIKPGSIRRFTMPTELERRGDFSQTVDSAGRPIVIRDPIAGEPFPGNIVPANRINPSGQALLNLFPLPNTFDRSLTGGQYNFLIQSSTDTPKRNHVGRVDYKPSDKDTITATAKTWFADQKGYEISAGGSANNKWGLVQQHYTFRDRTMSLAHNRTFTSNLLNESSFGIRMASEDGPPVSDAEWNRIRRSNTGFTLGQFHPENNPHDIIPRALFRGSGGVTNAPDIAYDARFVLDGINWALSFRDNVTYQRDRHLFKAGVYVERLDNREGPSGTFAGEFDFRRDVNNPLNTGYAYSNALLGYFKTYTESEGRPGTDVLAWLAEWYVQDTWKPVRRLTLDLGARFVWYQPWQQKDRRAAGFVPERWDPARAPLLYLPGTVDGQRVAVDPRNGSTVPSVFVGTIIPGTGDPANGMVTIDDPSYPDSFRDTLPPQIEPRVGFAYDLFGTGKTALRGGFGIFHETRLTAGSTGSLSGNPPIQRTPILYYGSFDTLLTQASALSLRPVDVRGLERHAKTPSTYSFRLGVQQDLGWGTVADVSYVGTLGRHLFQRVDLNTLPDGTKFLDVHPENMDPTSGRPLSDNFLRPYRGYENVYWGSNFGTSNYHALQVQVNRRYTRGLQTSVAYTLSSAKGITDGDEGQVALHRPIHVWHYGPLGFDQRHNLVINYTWDVPGANRVTDNSLLRALFSNWQLSGENAFVSGEWKSLTFESTDGFDFTGGTAGTRAVMTGNPTLPRDERTFDRWFDTSVFHRPNRGEFGSTPRTVFRKPGVNNWNLSLFRNMRLNGARRLQFRWEMYNVLNKTQFSDVNATARFDPTGAQVNTQFGQITAARKARIMQGSLRFSF